MNEPAFQKSKTNSRTIIARVLIGLVVFFNLQCALVFILHAQQYAPSFELSGPAGEAMVQGMGILFVMWNIPYLFALWAPDRQRSSLVEACLMQFIGVSGESLLYLLLPTGHAVLRASALRFIIFDGSGLIALVLAFWLSGKHRPAKAGLIN